MKKHLNITIHGAVQGVGFRYFIKTTADNLKVFGYSKNQPDGTLYIEVEAEEDILNNFVEQCKQGPASASIENVYTLEDDLKEYTEFRIAL